MRARSRARKHALDLLYAADLRGETGTEALQRALAQGEAEPHDYTTTLVRGVGEHQRRIDELLSAYSQGWTLDRMPAVDRNVLRLGVFELLYAEDVPEAVAMSEAVALVRELSTEESPTFVNGVLGGILRDKPTLVERPVP